ncbi:hypothetical protein [Aquimonas sp.]|jgi:hypothetical protein|uniref:hypothetical protein n=1 Tax=Aquimonas sp. TaxID=1872588 RepID=UPI0037C131CF
MDEQITDRPWQATVDFNADGHTHAILRRRHRGGVELRQGRGENTEGAIAAALGLPGARFDTRADDEGAAIAAFRMRPFCLRSEGRSLRYCGLA